MSQEEVEYRTRNSAALADSNAYIVSLIREIEMSDDYDEVDEDPAVAPAVPRQRPTIAQLRTQNEQRSILYFTLFTTRKICMGRNGTTGDLQAQDRFLGMRLCGSSYYNSKWEVWRLSWNLSLVSEFLLIL